MPKKLVSFGDLNITFSLELSKIELEKYSIDWEKLNNIKDISFIHKNKNLWDKIEIKSTDNIINLFLYMNRVNRNKIFVQYITLNEIIYNEEQNEFKNFVNKITASNFLFLTSEKIFNSISNIINIELIYENKNKIFPITAYSNTSNNILEEENNFIKLSLNESLFSFFDYIFLDYKKIKEKCDIINIKNLNKFCYNLKNNYGIKIISYLDNISLKKEEEIFFKLIDIYFYFQIKMI